MSGECPQSRREDSNATATHLDTGGNLRRDVLGGGAAAGYARTLGSRRRMRKRTRKDKAKKAKPEKNDGADDWNPRLPRTGIATATAS